MSAWALVGLRKKTAVFMEGNYLHNFAQSVFNALKELNVPVEGGTLVVSGVAGITAQMACSFP